METLNAAYRLTAYRIVKTLHYEKITLKGSLVPECKRSMGKVQRIDCELCKTIINPRVPDTRNSEDVC